MAEFKLCIADPKTGKTYKKDAKDDEISGFMGLNIGETVKGDSFGLSGFELQITGGSDFHGRSPHLLTATPDELAMTVPGHLLTMLKKSLERN